MGSSITTATCNLLIHSVHQLETVYTHSLCQINYISVLGLVFSSKICRSNMAENASQILLQCSTFVFSEFPVGQEVLARLILDNEFESDILKVTMLSFVVLPCLSH